MKQIRRIFIGFSVALLVGCCGAIIMLNWSVSGWKALTVPTSSMSPAIQPGSLVLMHSVPNSELRVGDVITYANPQKPGTTITHRITDKYNINGNVPAFITKGDANTSPDQPIVGGMVKGKVIWTVPIIGKWLEWTKTWAGVALLVYLPALIVMFGEAKRLVDYYRTMMPYKSPLILAREKVRSKKKSKFAVASVGSVALLIGSVAFALPVQALLRSNVVRLANNTIRVAPITPPNNCPNSGNNTTVVITDSGGNVNVTNSNNQNAQTGNATSSNGGNATSGNATNCNSTNINIRR
jgi:signal peptidase I